MFIVELLVVHAVQEEIYEFRDYSLATLFFDQFHDPVIGIGVILYKYLSYHTDFWLLDILKRQLIIFPDYLRPQLPELVKASVSAIAICVETSIIIVSSTISSLFIRIPPYS